MPIDLNHTDKLSSLIAGLPSKVTPKLFDKDLTGTGTKDIGYFNTTYRTLNDLYDKEHLYTSADAALNKLEARQDGYDVGDIHPVSLPVSDVFAKLTKPLSWLDFKRYADQFYNLGAITDENTDRTYTVYATNRIETMTKYKYPKKEQRKDDFVFSVRTYVLLVDTDVKKLTKVNNYLTTWSPDDAYQALTMSNTTNEAVLIADEQYVNHDNSVSDHSDTDRLKELFENTITTETANDNNNGEHFNTINEALRDFVANANVSQLLSSQALELTQHLVSDTQALVDSFKDTYSVDATTTEMYESTIMSLISTFAELQKYVNNYLTADDFTQLYLTLNDMQQSFTLDPADFNQLLTKSLRLLLAKSLSQLKVLSDQKMLYQFTPANQDYIDYVKSSTEFSNQQKKLILTTEPLTVGTAGAGSGKSHTLVGRLAYLKGEGEDLSKALVLSFTNTAADNIKRRYPTINSITLGNLFNQIYHTMFQNHELSASDTVINSLQLLDIRKNNYWKSNVAVERALRVRKSLCDVLYELNPHGFKRSNHNEALATLSQLVADNFNDVMHLLNKINQTTLELEPVVIYTMIMSNQKISLPSEYQDINYIITDESQDISTFEYILLTTLTAKYRANLMIMGDGTQTLYEFRSSNPQFLNAIEASGVFKSYKLTTNYRSNGAILQYANEFLAVIDANKYAHLQLQPNDLSEVTPDTFKSAVQVKDFGLDNTKGPDYITDLKDKLLNDPTFTQWVKNKVSNHEQVALMAFTRMETQMFTDVIQYMYQNDAYKPNVLDITPDRTRQETRLSTAISNIHTYIPQIQLKSYADTFVQLLTDSILNSFYNKGKAFIPRYVNDAINDVFKSKHYQSLRQDVYANRIPRSRLDQWVIRTLLKQEIRYNAVYTLIKRDEDDKTSQTARDNADILISTIHSAKGLEFDNTVVLYNEAKRSSKEQASLRLYGVALTRAKHNEFVINVHHTSSALSSKPRVITSNQSDMFKTPMMTARLRCLDELEFQQPTTSTTPSND